MSPGFRLLALLPAILLWRPASALAGAPVNCARAPGDTRNGPCRSADAFDVALGPMASRWALRLNFGIAWPSDTPGQFDLVCEEAFGLLTLDKLLVDDAGWVYTPGSDGLNRSRLGDGCTWSKVAGFPPQTFVRQVVRHPMRPQHYVALAVDGVTRVAYISNDGGNSFVAGFRFPENAFYWNIDIAPSNPDVIWANGTGVTGPYALARSGDGGQTFEFWDPIAAFNDDPTLTANLVGIAPDNPDQLFLARTTRLGVEQLWTSSDRGTTATRLLQLQNSEFVAGMAFGDDPNTLYVAGHNVLRKDGVPTGHLYISRDRGLTWEQPRASVPEQGPTYNCLYRRDGKLWACGIGPDAADPGRGDPFLLGTSIDEGQTWQAVMAVGTLPPIKSCIAQKCPQTVDWLCNTYGACGPDGGVIDAGVADAGVDGRDATGGGGGDASCSCVVPGSARARWNTGLLPLLVLLSGVFLCRRRHKRPRQPI